LAEARVQRRLAAILAADVVGYSRLMGVDEAGTLSRLNALRAELMHPKVAEYGGRIVKTTGDGTLIEFPSAVDAVQHAVDVQQAIKRRNADVLEAHRLEFRMGINLGDVIVEGDDIFGEGVNVAARLEGIAEPGGICVSALVHESVRTKLDIAFADLGEQALKNIAEPVRVFRVEIGGSPGSAADGGESQVLAMFRRPAVAVLPFENLSGDPDQDYFADGLTEDIITALSLWRSFPVIARNSTFAYKGTSPDIRRVGEELGARYVVEGSVRRAGNRVRVTAQLINAENGHHIWAERFDRDLQDIFDLQDELSQQIAATIAPELEFAKDAVIRTAAPHSLDAWELAQRGFAHVFALDPASIATAREYFEKAIAVEAGYANAYRGLAWSYHRELWLDPAQRAGERARRFIDAASRAVALDDADSGGHAILAMALFWSGEHDRALAEARRAVDLNPNDAHASEILGTALMLQGRPMEGLAPQERAILLSPRDPRQGVWFWTRGLAYLTARLYQEAADWSRRAIDRHAQGPDAHIVLASALGYLGRIEEARAALDAYGRLIPAQAQRPALIWRFKHDADNEHFLDGLRKAGWDG
jgi:adenylate cyclase